MSEGYEYTLHNRVLTFDGLLCMSRFGPVQNSYATWNCRARWFPGRRTWSYLAIGVAANALELAGSSVRAEVTVILLDRQIHNGCNANAVAT